MYTLSTIGLDHGWANMSDNYVDPGIPLMPVSSTKLDALHCTYVLSNVWTLPSVSPIISPHHFGGIYIY